MIKRIPYLVFIILTGLCGAALRCTCLLHGYEADSGLPKEGYLPAALLIALTAAVIVIAAIAGRRWSGLHPKRIFEDVFGQLGWKSRLCQLFSVGIMVLSVLGILWLPDQIAELYVLEGAQIIMPSMLISCSTALVWVLSFLSGFCLFLFAHKQRNRPHITKRTDVIITVPMFWSCLDLIMVYHKNSGNPVLSDYSYTLLLIIAVMAAFYSIGGFLYSPKPPAARFLASAGIAVYLALTQMGGTVAWGLLQTSDVPIMQLLGTGMTLRTGIYLLISGYLLILICHASFRHSPDL